MKVALILAISLLCVAAQAQTLAPTDPPTPVVTPDLPVPGPG